MKTTFKWLLCALFFVAVAVNFNRCSNDDNSDPTPSNSEKYISSFSFTPTLNAGMEKTAVGVIGENKISVNVLEVSNPKAMVATFTAKGSVTVGSMAQVSGVTANDFTKDVTYTVTAEDGSKLNYTVTVKLPDASGLPVMRINTENSAPVVSKEDYLKATFKITGSSNEAYNIERDIEIRGRGNSTWGYPKKPYRIKFGAKEPLFGLKEEKTWVLLANYQDPTLIMNAVAFELGQRLGLPFTNNSRYVDLYLNNVYQGTYQVTEQIEVEKNRVNVDKNTGCLLELDQYYDEPWEFRSSKLNLPVMIKSPKTQSAEMDANIKKWIADLENALFSASFPATNYADLIDVPTLINFLIVNELVRNTELRHPKSTYMFKDANGKFFMGPLWDFDWTFGYEDHGGYFRSPASDLLFKANYTGSQSGHKFFCRFFDDPTFRQQYKARWNEVKTSKLNNIGDYVTTLAAQLHNSQALNFQVWPNGLNYDVQISQMKTYLQQRIAYMDTEINKF